MQTSVLAYLENTARVYPNKKAVIDSACSLTFSEMAAKAKGIAYAIHNKYNIVKKPALIYLPKGCSALAAFMGVLYSGNFYTPTDVDYPFEKVRSVIKVLEPSFYISDSKYKDKLINNGISEENIINIDDIEGNNEYSYLENIIDTDIVYIIFTSGSTGVPKGVAVSNRSIIDYIDWAVETYKINSSDNIGSQAPFYFDNSVLDIYSSLCSGASLYIIKKSLFSFPLRLIEYIRDNNINMIFWVPSVFNSVANADILSRVPCKTLNKILFAGEVMPNKTLNYWRKYIPNALYSNLYGPTEITVDCTYYNVNREFRDDEPLPIGIPCRNSDVMIISEDNKLIKEEGIIGELCVRGSSLALGYYRNPKKTAESFVQNPLHNDYPEKIYKTGDLVYYNGRGEIMYSGRKDYQIKHLGYRIELGEIESASLGLKAVKNVCALYDDENKKIVLFYEGSITDIEIKKYLASVLPQYMVPSLFNKLSSFPLNDNGKIDRLALKNMVNDIVGGGGY